jgi:hypothetical protein
MAGVDFDGLLRDAIGLDASSLVRAQSRAPVPRARRRAGLDDVHGYWLRVRSSPSELQELIEAVVVPETWFFRDPAAFSALAAMAHFDLIAQSGAGPSPAQPAVFLRRRTYSMAIALLDAGLPANRFRIDAVDISARALALAEKGRVRQQFLPWPGTGVPRPPFQCRRSRPLAARPGTTRTRAIPPGQPVRGGFPARTRALRLHLLPQRADLLRPGHAGACTAGPAAPAGAGGLPVRRTVGDRTAAARGVRLRAVADGLRLPARASRRRTGLAGAPACRRAAAAATQGAQEAGSGRGVSRSAGTAQARRRRRQPRACAGAGQPRAAGRGLPLSANSR